MDRVDVAIIGGGPGGYLAAERIGQAGKKVLLVEKRQVGGVCLNEGCIPTKTFLYSAKIFDHVFRKGEKLGVVCKDAAFLHRSVVKRKDDVVKTLVSGVTDSVKKCKVKIVYANAELKKEERGFAVICGKDSYLADQVVLATGSEPVVPGIAGVREGMESGAVLTSRELLDLTEVPDNLVVVGGGVTGLEMAAYFNIAGSNVTVVEMMDFIGGPIEREASTVLQKNLEQLGLKFYLGSKVCDVSNHIAKLKKGSEMFKIPFDKLLMCVGRKPLFNVPGLLEMGLNMEKGAIVTDEKCTTNVPGLYAVGDVNGKYMLAHIAYREAEVAANNILGIADEMNYSVSPGVIYTQPEVAFAGMTEAQAKERGLNVVTKQADINQNGRHIAECGMSNGFIKIVLDEKQNIILGATLISSYASEIIYALALMIQNKIPVESIRKTIFPHPTVCEIIREVIF